MIRKLLSINYIGCSPLSIQELSGFDTPLGGVLDLSIRNGGLELHAVHSLRNAVMGLAVAALTVRMLIVSRAKPIIVPPARGKIHQLTGMR